MRPEDALGAMLRCEQAVIVGDPEQLPPTDFFTASDDTSDEKAEDAPEESILELGRRCWHPMRMLEVHYRSRHQSLIAYSNREFYGERLLVYPSPVLEDPDFGVSCRKIDGAYEVGQGRNLQEARAIVEEAAGMMRERADRSIGIVAMNQAQRDLIETLMDERAAADPDIQAYHERWDGDLEDFFVKNLENVQGDERDIILILIRSDGRGGLPPKFRPPQSRIRPPAPERALHSRETKAHGLHFARSCSHRRRRKPPRRSRAERVPRIRKPRIFHARASVGRRARQRFREMVLVPFGLGELRGASAGGRCEISDRHRCRASGQARDLYSWRGMRRSYVSFVKICARSRSFAAGRARRSELAHLPGMVHGLVSRPREGVRAPRRQNRKTVRLAVIPATVGRSRLLVAYDLVEFDGASCCHFRLRSSSVGSRVRLARNTSVG